LAHDHGRPLTVAAAAVRDSALLTTHGLLDTTSYRSLRDRIIKEALDEPQSVIVDVTDLDVPSESAWVVFTSAQWHVDIWPHVPIILVCQHMSGRSAIVRNGISRYVPVYENIQLAVDALSELGSHRLRRRATADLPAHLTSLARSRELVALWLTAWSQPDFIAVAKVVVTTFVENVLAHTDGPAGIRVESDGAKITVAVADDSRIPAGIRERLSYRGPTGLELVAALCRTWGNSPTPSGKTVWAVIGPENRI
jgi:hypothetical protein